MTGGASSDLEGATNTAEYMVKYLGMSDKVGCILTCSPDTCSPGHLLT